MDRRAVQAFACFQLGSQHTIPVHRCIACPEREPRKIGSHAIKRGDKTNRVAMRAFNTQPLGLVLSVTHGIGDTMRAWQARQRSYPCARRFTVLPLEAPLGCSR